LRFGQDVVSLRFLQNILIDEKIEDLLMIHGPVRAGASEL
jgi:hypothetical protein